MIDQDGVIPYEMRHGVNKPSNDILTALHEMSKDPRNIIVIVSPESKKEMHDLYSRKAPNVGLASENGFFWRWNSTGKSEQDWNQLIKTKDFLWIKQVRLIMQMYKDKTDGSYIIEKESSISWNFR